MATEADMYNTESMKKMILDKLKDYDWMDQMRLKCKTYIKNNGIKIISVDEVLDFLIEDATSTFPKNVHDELRGEITRQFNEYLKSALGDQLF